MVKKKFWKKFFLIMVPVSLIAFLIVAISFTFGTSDAGKGLSALEAGIALLAGLYAVFASQVHAFVRKHIRKGKKESKEAKPEEKPVA